MPSPPRAPNPPGLRSSRGRFLLRVAAITIGLSATPVSADYSLARSPGPLGMADPYQRGLLVSYYETLLSDEDVDQFRVRVTARYTEATLARLIHSSDPLSRRAAVLALGLVGSLQSNAAVASALKDADPSVRDLASKALWSIWFRADTPENNAALEKIAGLLGRGRARDAEQQASRLILRAPAFAEAYNQRAIALFAQGRFADSASDCRRALERNPFHIGALGGLAQCCLRLGQRESALDVFRRALELQPHDLDLRQLVEALEAGEP